MHTAFVVEISAQNTVRNKTNESCAQSDLRQEIAMVQRSEQHLYCAHSKSLSNNMGILLCEHA